jgi:uncharacterized repeat protein (TIGR01451 family)
VVIEDELPAGVVTTTGRNSVRVDVGTLAAGAAKQARFTAKAERTGSFTNRARATADGGLEATAECTTMVRQPVLEVDKSGPDMRYLGRPAEYSITVRNTGDIAAQQTVLTDDIPAGTQFMGASDGGQASGGQISWNLGTIEPGGSRTVTMTLKPTQPGVVRNTATARAYCTEASDSAQMNVEGIPAILLEVIDLDDPIEIGGMVTYVITVTNQGSAVGTNIKLVCTLPQQQSYSTAEGPTEASVDGQVVTFAALPSLQPKAKAAFRLTVKANDVGDVRFKVSMTTDQQTVPVEETESTNLY